MQQQPVDPKAPSSLQIILPTPFVVVTDREFSWVDSEIDLARKGGGEHGANSGSIPERVLSKFGYTYKVNGTRGVFDMHTKVLYSKSHKPLIPFQSGQALDALLPGVGSTQLYTPATQEERHEWDTYLKQSSGAVEIDTMASGGAGETPFRYLDVEICAPMRAGGEDRMLMGNEVSRTLNGWRGVVVGAKRYDALKNSVLSSQSSAGVRPLALLILDTPDMTLQNESLSTRMGLIKQWLARVVQKEPRLSSTLRIAFPCDFDMHSVSTLRRTHPASSDKEIIVAVLRGLARSAYLKRRAEGVVIRKKQSGYNGSLSMIKVRFEEERIFKVVSIGPAEPKELPEFIKAKRKKQSDDDHYDDYDDGDATLVDEDEKMQAVGGGDGRALKFVVRGHTVNSEESGGAPRMFEVRVHQNHPGVAVVSDKVQAVHGKADVRSFDFKVYMNDILSKACAIKIRFNGVADGKLRQAVVTRVYFPKTTTPQQAVNEQS